MSKFTFVLPDGQLFELKGTADTTREQAERIFNEQLAAGALIGLRRGDTIENVEAKIVDFTLSRLDRGTAGVDDLPLLAINNNGIISALPIVEAPVQNPINTANFAARKSSATPFTNGTSGPTTTKSTDNDFANSTIAELFEISTECRVAISAMPGLPGATCSSVTELSADSPVASACSRPPLPISSTFIVR